MVAIALTTSGLRAQPLEALPPVVGATQAFVSDARSGFGLSGFDPVSYFSDPAPVAGREGIELIWGGLAWRFASHANREAFARDPEVYAPRIGGYDPAAAAQGRLVAGDPAVFAVRDGRLYVFRDKGSRTRFLADPALAEKAEARWPALKRDLVRD
ncbi:MAG TPA: YHS domain-containing (seleno)protein [Beijerinckiaceae bacterium]